MKININFTNGTYKYLENPSSQKITGLITVLKGKQGICRVEYSKDYYNEFEFYGSKDFRSKLIPCIESQLIKEFK